MKMFKKLSFDKKLNYDNIYPTTHDIVCKILNEEKYKKIQDKKNSSSQNGDIQMLEFYAF
jgi:hypothetical protein